MSILMYTLRHMRNRQYYREVPISEILRHSSDEKVSTRVKEFRKKLRETSPLEKLEEHVGKHPYEEEEPLEPWPDNTNPHTGEIGGPRGPEPTRYGDWERKGRVTDF